MKIKHFINAIIISIILCLATFAQTIEQKADELINAYIKEGRFSGSVLIAKGGQVLLNKGYGMANYEFDIPNTPQTKFRLASITKQFTVMAIMQLQERGKLSVNDTISKYLPDYPKAVADKVTIHQLLTHTAGIYDPVDLPEFEKRLRTKVTISEFIALFKDKPLDFEPGTKFKYSNTGYIILTALIEKVSGKNYEDFLQENIFQPLGMKNTGYDHNETVLKNRASGYEVKGGKIQNAAFIDMSIPSGAGAVYSTTEDLFLYDRALNTEKLVKKSTLEQIFKPEKDSYAYGWVVDELFKHKRIWHNGGINGFRTFFGRFVNDDLCIILLSNQENSPTDRIAADLSAVALGEKYELPTEKKSVAVDPKILDKYVGEYELAPNFTVTVTRENDKLMIQATGQGKGQIFAESETKFFTKGSGIQITFIKNEKGEVTSFILNQGGREMTAKKIK